MHTVRHSPDVVAQWIADHLARHPDAADTADGIRRWWLAPLHGEIAVEIVEEALEALERSGVVSRHAVAGQAVYGRGPSLPARN
jgi:hypothetical protein